MARTQIQIISETFIKPSSVTPPSLKIHQLSAHDKIIIPLYIPLAFFYARGHGDDQLSRDQVSQLLRSSLSKTLSHYHQFAGRLVDNSHVDCNDMGVQLFEANVWSPVSEVLKRPNTDAKDLLFPRGIPWNLMHENGSIVIAQISYFECGGIAISLCISHKVADLSSVANFVNDWAAAARFSSYKPSPQIVSPTIFPMDDWLAAVINIGPKICPSRRFLFRGSKIVELKALAANSGVENPTRVEVVTALLHKCAVTASASALGSFMPNLLFQSVNLRPIISPPLPKTSIGNIYSCSSFSVSHENQMTIPLLVRQLRRSKTELFQKYGKELKESELLLLKTPGTGHGESQKLSDGDSFEGFFCSSWSRFPVYDADFGWERPVQVYVPSCPGKNTIFLIDTPNQDGFEALVALEEAVMRVFECDDQLLAFASVIHDS